MTQPQKHPLTPRIGSFSFEEYKNYAESFHGFAAPGLILGGFMVDLALRNLPPGILFQALCETSHCLPDAIQLLTPCTTGNGWLRVIDLGRFALSLYDKKEGSGIRVFLDPEKLEPWPRIKTWLFKLQDQGRPGYGRVVERDPGCRLPAFPVWNRCAFNPIFWRKTSGAGLPSVPPVANRIRFGTARPARPAKGRLPILAMGLWDLSKLGQESLCQDCRPCTFPKCPLGG